jgi:asparagine synthase (glutamine-hydrolysing)
MCGIFAYLNRLLKNKNDKTNDKTNDVDRIIYMLNNHIPNTWLADGVLQEKLYNATMKIQHRGPDNTHFVRIDPFVTFGFHRLSIQGIDSISNQPMTLVHENIYLICNGEIYNCEELCRKYNILRTSRSDCEVILHMYEKFGIDQTVKELDGEFAFCLYDQSRELFFVARDHLGIRPLFIGEEVAEIKSESESKSESDQLQNVMFCSEAKGLMGIAKNIHQYKPGQYTIYDFYQNNKNLPRTIVYYSFIYEIDTQKQDRALICKQFRELLLTSVHDRMVSDRPIGCFLSGGLDSSLVTSIVHMENPNIHTFTIGLKDSVDILAARKVVKYLNLKHHHEVTFTVDQGIAALPHVIRALESYDITTIRASTGQYILSHYIRNNTDIRVLLNGECIDEYSPGYFCFKFLKTDDEVQAECARMLSELHMYDLLRTDRTTASAGLETRCPFAAKALIDFMMSVPLKFRRFGEGTDNSLEKMLIRDAFNVHPSYGESIMGESVYAERRYLPDEILYRKKHAFSDGVSSANESWYPSVEAHARKTITEEKYAARGTRWTYNTPNSYEGYYYRDLFEQIYPEKECEKLISALWIPKIIDKKTGEFITDPSATILDGFTQE